jgi:DNA-directed RNA polymerase specialized sigma subunit
VLNDENPSPDHLNNFRAKLDAFHSVRKVSWFSRHSEIIRIAAVVIAFIGVGTFYFAGGLSFLRNAISEQIVAAELPLELQEVMQYYNVISNKKMDQIDELAVSEDEAIRVKEMAVTELKALEDARKELEKEYMKNPNNERIMNALLLNQQKKSEILDKILNVLSQVN